MDRLGYFGHVAIVAHPSFQLILPPEFRLGGGKKGRRGFLVWVEKGQKEFFETGIDIIFTGNGAFSSFVPQDASDDLASRDRQWGEGERERLKCKIYAA